MHRPNHRYLWRESWNDPSCRVSATVAVFCPDPAAAKSSDHDSERKFLIFHFAPDFFSPSFRNFRIRFLIWQFLSSFLSLQHYLRKLLRQNFSPDFFATGFSPSCLLVTTRWAAAPVRCWVLDLWQILEPLNATTPVRKIDHWKVYRFTLLIETGHPLSLCYGGIVLKPKAGISCAEAHGIIFVVFFTIMHC